MQSHPTAQVSEFFTNYVRSKLSDTINEFSDQVSMQYSVDKNRIIEIWNRVCPEISIDGENKKQAENKKCELEKPSKNTSSDKVKDKETDAIIGPDEDKVYSRDDIVVLITKMLSDKKIEKDNLKADMDNYKIIKKLLQKQQYEVSKSIIKKILSKYHDKIIENSTKVSIHEVEEFVLED
jgi:hypothetical protein